MLNGWYKGSSLEMDEGARSRKTTKFGSTKVYPPELMREMRAFFEQAVIAAAVHARGQSLAWVAPTP